MPIKIRREDFEAVVQQGLQVRLGSDPPPPEADLRAAQLAFVLGRYISTHAGGLPAAVVSRRRLGRFEALESMDPTVELDADDEYYQIDRSRLWGTYGMDPHLCRRARASAEAILAVRLGVTVLADTLGQEVEDEP